MLNPSIKFLKSLAEKYPETKNEISEYLCEKEPILPSVKDLMNPELYTLITWGVVQKGDFGLMRTGKSGFKVYSRDNCAGIPIKGLHPNYRPTSQTKQPLP